MIKKIMALGFLMTSSAFSAESLLEGTWLTKEQKATVEITKCNDNNALYCGKIIGLKEPFEEDGSAKVDKHNEDKFYGHARSLVSILLKISRKNLIQNMMMDVSIIQKMVMIMIQILNLKIIIPSKSVDVSSAFYVKHRFGQEKLIRKNYGSDHHLYKINLPLLCSCKRFIEPKNASFDEIEISGNDALRNQMIEKAGGKTTVPQIFIGDKHVGGCDDLFALDAQGGLDPLLG